jgi:hypothetical protein
LSFILILEDLNREKYLKRILKKNDLKLLEDCGRHSQLKREK